MSIVHVTTPKEKQEEQSLANHDRFLFDVNVKRDHLVGLWAAEIFGYKGDDAKRYATEVIFADLEEPGDEDIIRKLIADFDDHGVPITRQEIEKQLLVAEEKVKNHCQS